MIWWFMGKISGAAVPHEGQKIPPIQESSPGTSSVPAKIQVGSQSECVSKIQSLWRGFMARKSIPELYIESIGRLRNLIPKAGAGRTPVYLPRLLPVVLKSSGRKCSERLQKMSEVRAILDKNGYKHLIVPEARIHGAFLIETRLPCGDMLTEEYMRLYAENRVQFTEAVKEFTGFLCQAPSGDLVGGSAHYLNDIVKAGRRNFSHTVISGAPAGRYDNLMPYVQNGQANLAMIDLEGCSPQPTSLRNVEDACLTAIALFPYHFEDIIAEAKKFDPDIEKSRGALEKEKEIYLQLFKVIYEDHVNFLKDKGISPDNSTVGFDRLTISRESEVKQAVKMRLLEVIKDKDLFYSFDLSDLGENPEEFIAKFCEEAVPLALKELYETMDRHVNKHKKKEESSISELCAERSIHSDIDYMSPGLKLSGGDRKKLYLMMNLYKEVFSSLAGELEKKELAHCIVNNKSDVVHIFY